MCIYEDMADLLNSGASVRAMLAYLVKHVGKPCLIVEVDTGIGHYEVVGPMDQFSVYSQEEGWTYTNLDAVGYFEV